MLANLLIAEVAGLLGQEALLALMRQLGRKLAADLEHQVVDEARIVEHMNNAGYEAQVFFRSGASRRSLRTIACSITWPRRTRWCASWTWR